MVVDLQKNPKQEKFYNTAMEAVYGLNDYRILSYGGAIRGGKTFVCLALFTTFCKLFENSRWHVLRSDFPALQGTSIPSLEKIVGNSSSWGWNRDKANYFAYHKKTDSKIFFKAENKDRDPEMNSFLGLETNGFLFEQIEELTEKLWEIAQSRNGSWYIDPMPKPISLETFNPTQTWVKQKRYEPWKAGTLKAPFFFMEALPNDNAFVTKEQWATWGNLAERYQRQFIEGDWTDFGNNNRWAFAFDRKKHLGRPELSRDHYVILSFDFNKNPISAGVIQNYDDTDRIIEAIKLENSDIYRLCDYIKVNYPDCFFLVTGDATGRNTSALVKDNLNYYKVIKLELGLSSNQIKVPSINPRLEDNQVLVNSLLANYNTIVHQEKAKALIYDFENVKMLPDGSIEKRDREDPAQQADSLDWYRYYCNTFHKDYLKIPKY